MPSSRSLRQNHAAARAAQGLVGRGGDDMRVRQRAGEQLRRHQAGEMRHIDHEIRADLVRDFADAGKVDEARIGRPAGDDQLRLFGAGEVFEFLIIQDPVFLADAVLDRAEPFSRQVGRRAVRQMAAGGEAHAQHGVAGLQQRQEHRLVGLRAGVRLHVGEGAAEQLFGTVDRQVLRHVDIDATAVVAAAGIALGVFVGQHRPLRFQHRGGDDVLRRDQFDAVLLAVEFGVDRGGEFGVGFGQRGGKEALGAGSRLCWFMELPRFPFVAIL